jgi:hypothetical protein
MAMDAVWRQLQRNMTVMAEVEAMTAAGLKTQREWQAGRPLRVDKRLRKRHRRMMADSESQIRVLRALVERLTR